MMGRSGSTYTQGLCMPPSPVCIWRAAESGHAWCRQPTFTAHPWVFETVAAEGEAEGASPPPGGTVLVAGDHQVFYAPPLQNGGAVPVVAIRDSTLVPWSPAQHARFPSHFQAATRALLLAHHRSACEAASPSSSSDSSNGGSSCSSSLQQESAFGPSGISWAKRLLRRLSCCGKAVRQQATPLTADPLCEVFGKLPHVSPAGAAPAPRKWCAGCAG